MIHYEEAGTGDAVVLLHAGGMDLRSWDDQVPALSATHRVIRVDARGHGRSPTPTEPFRQCDDIAELLDHLGVRRATLVGVSMGAGAATDTALEYPRLVSGLVVSGAGTNESVFTDPWILDLQRRMAEAQQRMDAATWMELYLQVLVVGPDRTADQVDPDVLARCREMLTATVTNHVRPEAVAPTHVPGSWERLGEIGVPAMGIYGALDVTDHVAMVERFAAAVPGCALVRIDGAGHMPAMERPGAFTDAVLDLLAKVG
ncbi:alpha/beta fold hydrolase [Jidongwangia harbinensis]|uniref:alpha/beta fold hydrolase n=1 Tax=Jidongwangia harbinensis TaxID=2878561 RepID=UPI001CD990BD|nr:alpha/beta fold hydrolase [Jidongwangia harbinensis]MCA2218124.1 alpha/beta fold hydrolase [Jidongwangia harbinensis]